MIARTADDNFIKTPCTMKHYGGLHKRSLLTTVAFLTSVFALLLIPSQSILAQTEARFAVIGDFGAAYEGRVAQEKSVADMIKSWMPDFIITLGDNNYPKGKEETFKKNITDFYGSYIMPYTGDKDAWLAGNRFFPSLGNHDWGNKKKDGNAKAYLRHFFPSKLGEGEGRYYDYVKGPVHFFVLDSDPNEPDGRSQDSKQGDWLKAKLKKSKDEPGVKWRIVYFHHTPFTSGTEDGPTPKMDWPFKSWGVDVVMAGHEHNYERFQKNGMTYIVNGAGGQTLYKLGKHIADGSKMRHDTEHGAMLVTASQTELRLQFFVVRDRNTPVDDVTLSKP